MPKLALLPLALCLAVASTACGSSGGSASVEVKAQQSAEEKESACNAERNGADFYSLSAECQSAINAVTANLAASPTAQAQQKTPK